MRAKGQRATARRQTASSPVTRPYRANLRADQARHHAASTTAWHCQAQCVNSIQHAARSVPIDRYGHCSTNGTRASSTRTAHARLARIPYRAHRGKKRLSASALQQQGALARARDAGNQLRIPKCQRQIQAIQQRHPTPAGQFPDPAGPVSPPFWDIRLVIKTMRSSRPPLPLR